MTGDSLPAERPPGYGGVPEQRASHADRDKTVEILRVAAGDGRLTAAELDERLEAALTARTGSELAALTADLRAVQPQVKDLVRIDQRFGDVSRTGHNDIKTGPGAHPDMPVTLRVELTGRVRGGDVVARFPRRTFLQWLRRAPRPYRALTGLRVSGGQPVTCGAA